MKGFLQTLLKSNFSATENVVHAFGYGSAVFQQANYNIDTPNQVIDLILIVDSAEEFHSKNFKDNYSHYSGISKRLPLSVTHTAVQRSGSRLYFNPLIPIRQFKGHENDQRRLKYGVIQKEDALQDLTQWDRFALAGRMQKPILNIFEDQQINEAQDDNLKKAIRLAMLLNFHRLEPVDLQEIYLTLCNFSYKGDIRMRWKMENPDKVKNIVQGSLEGLHHLYRPYIKELESLGILTLVENDSSVLFKHREEHLQTLFDSVPSSLKYNMKSSVKQLSLPELQGDLEKHLAGIVDVTSIYMILGGVYSTNPLKGIPYLYQKFKKGKK